VLTCCALVLHRFGNDYISVRVHAYSTVHLLMFAYNVLRSGLHIHFFFRREEAPHFHFNNGNTTEYTEYTVAWKEGGGGDYLVWFRLDSTVRFWPRFTYAWHWPSCLFLTKYQNGRGQPWRRRRWAVVALETATGATMMMKRSPWSASMVLYVKPPGPAMVCARALHFSLSPSPSLPL